MKGSIVNISGRECHLYKNSNAELRHVITDQKTTNSVKYHHYAIVQLQKNVYLCRQNSTK